ncbi:NAD(P)H-binding protein [Kribbella albertanoniae]|uniref:NAD-dependent epimerase/dehydratase family protein n=1 Tax=Kribbella albertanoniae TaxID=1266829 RepID=A0A4R4QII0_9ACTN|nr:NAD(P)H-binding protein [Kribbella albertanoniae]TDC35464.1 NAD-dependent epimerase/dehydratase family protein [Kribbella albertanoniae]
MKIAVIGGSGLIGSKLVPHLAGPGHEVTVASRRTGVDTLTGAGLKEVLADADIAVDVTNSPSFADDDVLEFFRTSTGNLVSAAQAAGVQHYVALSVVGCDRMADLGYMRAKVAQETLIRESGLPYSIVRATQFFEFAGGIADAATVDGEVRAAPAGVQPIAADDVATAVARRVLGSPINDFVEHAGPEVLTFASWIRAFLSARSDVRRVVVDSKAQLFGAVPRADMFLPSPGATLAPTTLAAWLTAG